MFQQLRGFLSKVDKRLRALIRLSGEVARFETTMAHIGEENSRIAALYESATSRIALLEAKLPRISEEFAHAPKLPEKVSAPDAADIPFPPLRDPSTYLPLHIVDVGAQPLASEEHIYERLIKAGTCRITGFEPLPDKAAPKEGPVRVLGNVLGTGGPGVFHVAWFDPTSSLLEPNLPFLGQFMFLADTCKTVSEYPVQTTRLDDIQDITDCDFLKLDVQGGELDVLRGSERLLEQTVVVHTEVEFAPIYLGQPLFADVDTLLRDRGFELMDLIKFGHNTYAEMPSQRSASRLLWSDAIYFRNLDSLAALGPQKLLRAAYIAHTNYRMWDLAAHILARYDRETNSKLLGEYLQAVDR